MAFKLKSASKFTKTLTLEYAGESVTFDYKPHATSFEEGLELGPQRRQLMYDLSEAGQMQAHFETRYENELKRLESSALTDQEKIGAIWEQGQQYKQKALGWKAKGEQLYRATELLDVEEVCRLIVRWDVFDEEDKAIPTDKPALVAKLPAKLLELILEAIDKDAKPDPQNAPHSSTTSSAEASAATAPTGS